MLKNKFKELRMFEEPEDHGADGTGTDGTDDANKQTEDPKSSDEKPTVPNKDQRRIRQDAINQFKGSDEFKQMMAETMAEGEKRAKMSAEEKAKADREAEDQRRAKDEANFKREKASFRAERALTEAGLPDIFKDSLIFPDDETGDKLSAHVMDLTKSFNDAVHDGVLKAMQGTDTPKSGTGNGVPTTSITQKDWDNMKYSEQLKIWQESPDVAKKFMSQL